MVDKELFITMQQTLERRLVIVLSISGTVFAFELIGGILSQSLALISDSMHVLLDFSAIGISLLAFRIAKRPRSQKLSYGFHRIEILAALVNGISLIGVSLYIFYESYRRALQPPSIDTPLLLTFATIGLVANCVMIFLLKKDKDANLNIRGSYLHVLGDLLASIGVVIGAIVMQLTGLFLIDAIVSIGIGILIARSGIILCKECLAILMQKVPKGVQTSDVSKELEKFEGITKVTDIHVWTLTSNLFVMSAHVKVRRDFTDTNTLLNDIHQIMHEKFGIHHCTIQIEKEYGLINPNK